MFQMRFPTRRVPRPRCLVFQHLSLCPPPVYEEALEALSQVLLVDSTLVFRSHARRIINPEEHDGYIFLYETGGPVMLDAAGLEEAVAAWLTDASGTRTNGYLTANSQPAQQGPAARAHWHQRAEAAVDQGGQEAEAPAAALATDHLELVRRMSSLHSLRVPQQRMPSSFGALPMEPSVQGAPLLGMSLPEPRLAGPLARAVLGIQQSPPRLAGLSFAAPAPVPLQVPEEAPATTDPQAPCARPGRRRRPHDRSQYGPCSIINLCWCARRRCSGQASSTLVLFARVLPNSSSGSNAGRCGDSRLFRTAGTAGRIR